MLMDCVAASMSPGDKIFRHAASLGAFMVGAARWDFDFHHAIQSALPQRGAE
jgi:hypothetical protein